MLRSAISHIINKRKAPLFTLGTMGIDRYNQGLARCGLRIIILGKNSTTFKRGQVRLGLDRLGQVRLDLVNLG